MIREHEALKAKIEGGAFGPDILAELDSVEERLHGGMLASLRNPLVETTARRLKNYVRLIRLERLVTQPLALHTLREHLDILRAIEARDGDAAERAVAAHFQAALQRILGMF
jgi:DNA-binding GntR family transcriptional regulator